MTSHSDPNKAHGARKLGREAARHWQAHPPVPAFELPQYAREDITAGIVHIGVGGFHRAHMAVYLHQLMQRKNTQWGICGVGLLPSDAGMRDALKSQDFLYTVAERSAEGEKAHVIGSIVDYLLASDGADKVIAKMADKGTHIVSLTITESGYFCNEATGELDKQHPDIAHDLNDPDHPKTVYGYLTLALERRQKAGLKPFTLMSCDNLQQNGTLLRKMLLAFVRQVRPALAQWLADEGAFPNTMVDRITPRTTVADREMLAKTFGIDDAWPVVTEPFMQWIIEDDFCDGRPPWEEVGAQFVKNVESYEMMKLRLLNASHSAMGYLGYLAGYQYIHEIIGDPQFRRYIRAMMASEVRPLLPEVPGIDLDVYCETLITRFSNPTIMDQATRICMHGSGKIPKFILPSIIDQVKRDGPMRLLSLCVASWFRYLTGKDEQGRAFTIDDPMAHELQARAEEGKNDPRVLIATPGLFPDSLRASPAFLQEVREALESLYKHGARATLAKYQE